MILFAEVAPLSGWEMFGIVGGAIFPVLISVLAAWYKLGNKVNVMVSQVERASTDIRDITDAASRDRNEMWNKIHEHGEQLARHSVLLSQRGQRQ